MDVFVGIDPGLGGAIATLVAQGGVVQEACVADMPTVRVRRGRGMRREYVVPAMVECVPAATLVALEHLLPMPRAAQGAEGRGSIGAFYLGRGVGLWEGIFATRRQPYVKVLPVVWKRRYGLLGTEKGVARLRAMERFPQAELHLKKHDGRADALWLALYAMEQHVRGVVAETAIEDAVG